MRLSAALVFGVVGNLRRDHDLVDDYNNAEVLACCFDPFRPVERELNLILMHFRVLTTAAYAQF